MTRRKPRVHEVRQGVCYSEEIAAPTIRWVRNDQIRHCEERSGEAIF